MQPEQGRLFDLGTIDFRRVRETEERIKKANRALNTVRAYASGWKYFQLWCSEAGREALPTTPATVQDFISWCINEGFRLETVSVRMNAIIHYHAQAGLPSPVDQSVRAFLKNARRDRQEEPGGKLALTPAQLRKIVRRLDATPVDVRNRAMILLAFGSGSRRSEIARLKLANVVFERDGVKLWIAKSKTDQEGKGRWTAANRGENPLTCPVRALRQWLAIRGDWEGALFVRLTPGYRVTRQALNSRGDTLYTALKAALEGIGEDARKFGAHSLRSGMVTAALEKGAAESAIMLRTGHTSLQTMRRYARPGMRLFKINPLRGVL